MIRWFIGYDSREPVAYHVLAHSLLELSSLPISITPIALQNLHGIFNRERGPWASTEFSISRFLVPYLAGGKGWAVFSDCDMLCRQDPAKLWALRDERYALRVVKHDHQPTETTKFLGQAQTAYPRKNWSSVMLINCAAMAPLWNPSHVQEASGLELHRFLGVDDDRIGDLPRGWNHLVDVDEPNPSADLVHWTLGGPYFRGFERVEFAQEWWQTYRRMTGADDPAEPPPAT